MILKHVILIIALLLSALPVAARSGTDGRPCRDAVCADEGVAITNPDQVSGLVVIQDNLDAVSSAIMRCMDAGREHNACMCEHRELVFRFNASVKKIYENHPDLVKHDLVRFQSPDGIRISQRPGSLKKQADTDLSCE